MKNGRKNFRLPLFASSKVLILFSLLFVGNLFTNVYGQSTSKRISGKVADISGEPLVGVTVMIKNSTTGTITDVDGNYFITASGADAVLVFSYIGYTAVEQAVVNRTEINVTLKDDTELLDEVVVVGYGTMKKRDLSGAISQVKADEILAGNPASSINQALQGKIAGVVVNQSDGAPGGGVNIQIRGTNTTSANSQPLFVVDGIPFEPPITPRSAENTDGSVEGVANVLSFINPHDIESIEVLKDASATAIYGSRGANGVVLITTKKGVQGKPRVDLSANFSVATVRKKIDMLDAYTYANYRNEQVDNLVIYGGGQVSQYYFPDGGQWRLDGSSYKYFPSPDDFLNPGMRYHTDDNGRVWGQMVEGTNWQDQIFQTAFSHEYNVSVSGATESGSYMFSGNYTNQEGILKATGFDRYTLRTNLTQKVHSKVNLGLNMSYTNSNTNFAQGNSLSYGMLRSAIIYPSSVYSDDYNNEFSNLNPHPLTYVTEITNVLASSNIFSSAFVTIDITDFLQFRQNLGLSNFFNERRTYSTRLSGEGMNVGGRGGYSDNRQSNFTSESMLSFNMTFNKIHQLNAVAALTSEQGRYSSKVMSASNFPTDIIQNFDMGSALQQNTPTTSTIQNRLFSVLGRVNYVLLDRYIFTASFRRDGSSKFAQDNRHANFASGAIAWRLSEEQFIKNLGVFDNLKLRASFGQTGNQAIPDYRTWYILQNVGYAPDGNRVTGYKGAFAYNENLKWETTDQYNAGIDFGFLNNRLNFNVDYYFKNTRDLLQDVKIPQSTGYISRLTNMGRVTNEGLEFSLDYTVIDSRVNKFSWNVNGNLSFNRNRIADLEADQFAQRLWHAADNVFIQRNNCPIGSIYGYVEDGFYDNEAEVRTDPVYASASNQVVRSMIGEIKLRDINGDGEINASDMTVIGNTNPDYTFGITNNFKWKGFSFGFFIQGVIGNEIFNGNLMNVTMYQYQNIPTFAYEGRWAEDNEENATWPKALNSASRALNISNRYVENGSYLRLKNVNLGYRFQNPFDGVNFIDLNLSASNLLTLTKYRWYDPDVNAFGSDPSRRGVDIYSYPASRTVNLGIKAQF